MSSLAMSASDTFVLAKRNLARIPRQPDLLIAYTVQPVMFVLLFVFVFGGAIQTPGFEYVDFLMPGIIVRIDRVATTKIEAKKLPAAPACSARWEVSIGANQTFGCERDRGQASSACAIIMFAEDFDIRRKTEVSTGIWRGSRNNSAWWRKIQPARALATGPRQADGTALPC